MLNEGAFAIPKSAVARRQKADADSIGQLNRFIKKNGKSDTESNLPFHATPQAKLRAVYLNQSRIESIARPKKPAGPTCSSDTTGNSA